MSMNRCGSVSTLLSTYGQCWKVLNSPFLKGRTRLLDAKIALPLLPKFQPHVDEPNVFIPIGDEMSNESNGLSRSVPAIVLPVRGVLKSHIS